MALIKINLTPEDEIRSRTWFIPDLVFASIAVGLIWYFANIEISRLKENLNDTEIQISKTSKKLKGLSDESKKYYTLNARIQIINNKILAINTLTSNLVRHYKPLLLLEILQITRPKNLWLYSIEHDYKDSIIKISGGAIQSNLIAKYIQSLKNHERMLPKKEKLLRELHISKTALERMSKSNYTSNLGKERVVDAALLDVINDKENDKKNSLNQFSNTSSKKFSDIKDFPEFKLNLKYKEHKKTI